MFLKLTTGRLSNYRLHPASVRFGAASWDRDYPSLDVTNIIPSGETVHGDDFKDLGVPMDLFQDGYCVLLHLRFPDRPQA